MIGLIAAFGSGALFAAGLALAGMTHPSKVAAFLDVGGDWDPSLAFVMGGALAVMVVAVAVARRMGKPLGALRFAFPTREMIDAPLVVGAGLFGIGWGISGLCPGPAVASLGALREGALVFVPFMFGGMVLHRLWEARGWARTPAPLAATSEKRVATALDSCG